MYVHIYEVDLAPWPLSLSSYFRESPLWLTVNQIWMPLLLSSAPRSTVHSLQTIVSISLDYEAMLDAVLDAVLHHWSHPSFVINCLPVRKTEVTVSVLKKSKGETTSFVATFYIVTVRSMWNDHYSTFLSICLGRMYSFFCTKKEKIRNWSRSGPFEKNKVASD